jgi:hypothetical protein
MILGVQRARLAWRRDGGFLVVEGVVYGVGVHRGEHVQDLVAFVTGTQESLRGVPDLGWVVVPELVRDDLVHRDV